MPDMKTPLILALLLVSCTSMQNHAPSWVSALRSGETSLRIQNGNSLFFRRIAPSCDQATSQAQNDINAAYPQFEKVAQVIELVYYDRAYNDCAVTISVPLPIRPVAMTRPELAQKHAIKGLDRSEFESRVKEDLILYFDFRHPCGRTWSRAGYTNHGTFSICWGGIGSYIVGTCDSRGCQ